MKAVPSKRQQKIKADKEASQKQEEDQSIVVSSVCAVEEQTAGKTSWLFGAKASVEEMLFVVCESVCKISCSVVSLWVLFQLLFKSLASLSHTIR